jgi:hypothetical protein
LNAPDSFDFSRKLCEYFSGAWSRQRAPIDSERLHRMTDRLGPILPELLTDAQRAAAQAIIDGPRGALYGPFVPLLRSPELIIDDPSVHGF